MGQWLTLSRAAHLIGITRGALQKKIRDGELPSFDGMVATEDLCRAYPDGRVDERLDSAGAFERIVRIKDEAFGRRVRERLLPSQEVLAQRLFAQSQEAAALRRHLARYHDLIEALQARIGTLTQTAPSAPLDEIGRLLDQGLAAVLGSEDNTDTFAVMDDILRVISARVTLKPSGREFLLEGNDTLLAAALKAGAAPSYGCGNGNCGLCKCRLVSGEVRRILPSDYQLSETERQQGFLLMCAHTAVSDVVVEALEAAAPTDIPDQNITARVRALSALDADTVLLHLQTPRTNRLRFLAGQGVTLGIAGKLADYSGDYPIASCPCDDRNLHFHIRRDGADEFAERLFAGAVKGGDAVNVRGPWGDFVIAEDAARPLLFIAAATGFAPMKSLIEHAMAADTAESLSLYWSAAPGGHYLANQCRAWADALDEFRYVEIAAGADAAAAAEVLAALRRDGVDLAACDVFVAGAQPFVAALQAALGEAPRLRCQVIC